MPRPCIRRLLLALMPVAQSRADSTRLYLEAMRMFPQKEVLGRLSGCDVMARVNAVWSLLRKYDGTPGITLEIRQLKAPVVSESSQDSGKGGIAPIRRKENSAANSWHYHRVFRCHSNPQLQNTPPPKSRLRCQTVQMSKPLPKQ